jgi:DNA polymerase-3 subunit epsilon
MQLFEAPLAIVDVETTGAHPARDRLTEIAVLEVERGEIASEWSTLIDPQTPIPAAIQALTGITDEMVAGAPRFAALAAALHERLAGRVLVAHNARFDYGFLRREFERAGIGFQARTLCTVGLSRRLYPEHARHDLDSLIERHGLRCAARHRALGDARAVWDFLCVAGEQRGAEALAGAARQLAWRPAVPPRLVQASVDAIPEAPGVYLFFGERDAPLYVGKSVAMRSRVLAHFAEALRSPRAAQLAREVRRIEWQRCCGELSALLREAGLVKALQPAYNRRLRPATQLCGFVFEPHRDPAHALRLASACELDGAALGSLHGLFRSRGAALRALRSLADEAGLCLQTLGLERRARARGGCFRAQLQRCRGVCLGRESPLAHQARLAAALARLPRIAWPWRGPIGVVEHDDERDATEVHVIQHWCWLGAARSEDEIPRLLEEAARPRFDLDQYRTLARHLGSRRARVVELANPASACIAS